MGVIHETIDLNQQNNIYQSFRVISHLATLQKSLLEDIIRSAIQRNIGTLSSTFYGY